MIKTNVNTKISTNRSTSTNTKIEIISSSSNPIYSERESGLTHSPFEMEYILYTGIKLGNIEQVNSSIAAYLKSGLVVGHLSNNSLRQMQYWAIACISIAIHYAILGGLDETDAYNLSDIYIRQLDRFSSMDEIISYLKEQALCLTSLVGQSKYKGIHSPAIRQCLHYINIHLHDKLPIALLARECNLSRDYLSTLFKKEMNSSLHAYILHEKLEESKLLLAQKESYADISYTLSFCSESHFITCFKREYGITPVLFRSSLQAKGKL